MFLFCSFYVLLSLGTKLGDKKRPSIFRCFSYMVGKIFQKQNIIVHTNTPKKCVVFLVNIQKPKSCDFFEPKFVQKTHETKSNSCTFRRLKSLLLNQNQEYFFFYNSLILTEAQKGHDKKQFPSYYLAAATYYVAVASYYLVRQSSHMYGFRVR